MLVDRHVVRVTIRNSQATNFPISNCSIMMLRASKPLVASCQSKSISRTRSDRHKRFPLSGIVRHDSRERCDRRAALDLRRSHHGLGCRWSFYFFEIVHVLRRMAVSPRSSRTLSVLQPRRKQMRIHAIIENFQNSRPASGQKPGD